MSDTVDTYDDMEPKTRLHNRVARLMSLVTEHGQTHPVTGELEVPLKGVRAIMTYFQAIPKEERSEVLEELKIKFPQFGGTNGSNTPV